MWICSRLDLLEEQVKGLQEKVWELENRDSYTDPNHQESVSGWSGGWLGSSFNIPRKLSATDIIARLQELYDALGLERKELAASPAKGVLEKKKKS